MINSGLNQNGLNELTELAPPLTIAGWDSELIVDPDSDPWNIDPSATTLLRDSELHQP